MLKNVISSIGAAAHRLMTNWRASVILLVLYLAMLLAVYIFLVTGVATIGELLILGLSVVVAGLIFFVIQAIGVGYMADEAGAGRLVARSLKGFWKLVIITIPFVLLAWLLLYLIGKIPAGTAVAHEAMRSAATPGRGAAHPAPQPTDWRGIGLAALQFLLFGIALPLAAVNLWIAAGAQGLGHAARRAHRILFKSFAPGTLLIYVIGLLIFGVVPYLLVDLRPPVKGEWIEVGQLGVQLAVAGFLSLFGWILTLGALTQRQKSETATAGST
jgi:hypothetical protein